jgi:hypothetical protein
MLLEPKRFPCKAAKWALKIALFCAQLVIAALLLHRFGSYSTPAMLAAVAIGLAGGMLAALLSVFAGIRIWRRGQTGAFSATTAFVLAGLMLAGPVVFAARAWGVQPLNDVTTDVQSPPGFVALAQRRTLVENSPQYRAAAFAGLQQTRYPDVKPITVHRGVMDSFVLAREIVQRQGWTIADEAPPSGSQRIARIEAVARTQIIGFSDDLVIRLADAGRDTTRIDVRSASRYGRHDFGRNAERVLALLKELHVRLDLGVPLDPVGRRGRRGPFTHSTVRGGDQATAAPQASEAGQSRSSARREPERKAAPRSRAADRDRDTRRRRSQE